ncbi:glycoside hydrolase family 13 protein [Pseudoalteromonas sp. SSDWG2]|uniref:glycoside hydrolase family 13 protein n=1 Tax=Pseudoalteromonas sp. SSDWG2 TaxID=3139391 RepID=UPI003BAB1424
MRALIIALSLLMHPVCALDVAPTHWWVGMNNPVVQLMVHERDVANSDWQLVPYEGVELTRVHHLQSPNYVFLTLTISDKAQAGTLNFKSNHAHTFTFDLKERKQGSAMRRGFDSNDVVYLINPDRFANGDSSNDNHPDMVETVKRDARDGRRGGDLQGIVERLDYIKDMGFTQIWLTPARENNMEQGSYHGYAMTDLYRIDPRMGTNEQYQEFVAQANARDMGVIMDMVPNHIGVNHPWMSDLPSSDWINNNGEFVANNHRRQTVMDPHVSDIDRFHFNDAWFVPSMPDLNQRIPELSTYLIQNSIWWVEFAGLSGIRIDTNSYSDKAFMARWSQAVMDEYPQFNMVGEEWTENAGIVAYWQSGKKNMDGYESHIKSMMDFPLQSALVKALNEPAGWHTGWAHVYQSLGNDFMYANPQSLLIFADNHDMSRIYSQLGQSVKKTKLAMALILTTRGIPQVYYGTEILLNNTPSNEHGDIRIEFPGGFEDHQHDARTGKGLLPEQVQMQAYVRTLLRIRKAHPALRRGSLMHFVPDEDIYVYVREYEQQKVLVVLNKGKARTIDLKRYAQAIGQAQWATNLMGNTKVELKAQLQVPAEQALILALQ